MCRRDSLVLDGSSYDTTLFCELAAVLGTNVLRDKRGRVEAGVDGGTGRLTANAQSGNFYGFGANAVLGAASGLKYHALTANEMPQHRHSISIYDPGHTHTYIAPGATNIGAIVNAGASAFFWTSIIPPGNHAVVTDGPTYASGTPRLAAWDGTTFDVSYYAGASYLHSIVQPTIITQKLIRAC